MAAALLIGGGTALLWTVFELFLRKEAWAHDSGWSEGGRSVTGVLTSAGAAEGVGRSGADGIAGGLGGAVPPMEGEEEEPPQWSLRGSAAPGKLDARPGASFTVSFTVTTTDPEGDPAAVASGISLGAGGQAAEWFTCTSDEQSGATRTFTFLMNEIDLKTIAAGAYSMSLHASAPSPGGALSASAGCTILVGGEPKLVFEFDGGKSALLPDSGDSAVLKAKVILVAADGTETLSGEASDTIQFTAGNEWVDLSDSVQWDATWRAVTVMASDPQGADVIRQPPTPVSITMTATAGETEVSASASLQLLPPPDLDVDLRPDIVTLVQGETTPVTFKAFITNPGQEPWNWDFSLDQEDFASVSHAETSTPGVVAVTVTASSGATGGSDGSGASSTTKLHIFARRDGKELERVITVALAREGLVVLPRGLDAESRYVLTCDMEAHKEIDFAVYTKNSEGKLEPDPVLVKNLWFEDAAPSQELRNVLSVAAPKYDFARLGEGGVGTWSWRSTSLIPGELNQVHAIPMTARVIGKEEKEEFSVNFTLGLRVIPPDADSEDWKRELAMCYIAIKFVPEPHKARLQEMIERFAPTLGHEGLKVFRKKIWNVAQNLILAEGLEGYKDEALWADRCLYLAENIKWGTDLVFQAAAGVAFGPVGVIGAPMLKGLIEKILVVASERGFGEVDDWFWECVVDLEQTLDWQTVMAQGALVTGGMVTDPAVLETILGKSPQQRAAAWAIYVGFQFVSNMARGMSMCDAIKQTARTVRDRVVVQFLMGRMKWQFQTPQLIKDAMTRMTGNPPRMTNADMIAIQSDPQMLRSLKTAPPEVQQGFLRTYNQALVHPHDAQLVSFVRSLPDYRGRVVRVETFSTPGKGGSGVGADRDFRVTMQNPDGTWSEVPANLWRGQSNTIVQNLSGRTHQQLNWRGTDRFDIEASPDYATQNGQIANIVRVNRGQATLRDPQQFGNMWHQKMMGTEPGHSAPPLEGVAQAQKAIGALNGARRGYVAQGYNVGNLTPQMQKGMGIIQGADVTANGNFSQVDQALRGAGFQGGFNEFANKLSSQFHALGMARRS